MEELNDIITRQIEEQIERENLEIINYSLKMNGESSEIVNYIERSGFEVVHNHKGEFVTVEYTKQIMKNEIFYFFDSNVAKEISRAGKELMYNIEASMNGSKIKPKYNHKGECIGINII